MGGALPCHTRAMINATPDTMDSDPVTMRLMHTIFKNARSTIGMTREFVARGRSWCERGTIGLDSRAKETAHGREGYAHGSFRPGESP